MKDGDQEAFSELARRHRGWVMSVALRRCCGRRELAEEAAQNVFVALARKAGNFRGPTPLPPWLHQVTVLETAALVRREMRQRRLVRRHAEQAGGPMLSFRPGAGGSFMEEQGAGLKGGDESVEEAVSAGACASGGEKPSAVRARIAAGAGVKADAVRAGNTAATAVAVASVKAAEEAWQAVRELVDEALQALAAADRELLVRHHVEGRGFADIAEELGTSEAAAQRRGHRALGKLANRLNRLGFRVGSPVLGLALAAGMRGEAAAAVASGNAVGWLAEVGARVGRAAVSGSAASVSSSVSGGAAAAATAGGGAAAGWMASPLVLAAVALISAGVPFWQRAGTLDQRDSQKERGLAGTSTAPAGMGVEASKTGRTGGPETGATATAVFSKVSREARLAYLRQALERLGQSPPEGREAESLGIRLRHLMLGLEADELEDVGALLAGVKRNRAELRSVAAAFSTRLAALRPEWAAELLTVREEGDPRHFLAELLDKSAVLDVLSRSALPEALRVCENDDDLKRRLVQALAGHSPQPAMEYAEKILAASPQALDRADYLWPWSRHDCGSLVKWLDANAESRPVVLERANSLHPGGFAPWVVKQMPPEEGVRLTLGLQDPVIRNSFVSALYINYSHFQPEALAGLAPLLQLADSGKPLSVSKFVTTWRRKDESAVASWVHGLTDGELKARALRVLVAPPLSGN